MNQQSTQNLAQYLKNMLSDSCPLDEHNEEPLDRVCIEENCSQKGLICEICKLIKHQNCKVITLHSFLKQFHQQTNDLQSTQQKNQLKNISIQNLSQKNENFIQNLVQINQQINRFKCEIDVLDNRQQQLTNLFDSYIKESTKENFEKLIQEIHSFSPSENCYSFTLKIGKFNQPKISKEQIELLQQIQEHQNKLEQHIQDYFQEINRLNKMPIIKQEFNKESNDSLLLNITQQNKQIINETNKSVSQIETQHQQQAKQKIKQQQFEIDDSDLLQLITNIDQNNVQVDQREEQITKKEIQIEPDPNDKLEINLDISQQNYEISNNQQHILHIKMLKSNILIFAGQLYFQILNLNSLQITPIKEFKSVINCIETLNASYPNQFLIATQNQEVYQYQYDELKNSILPIKYISLSQSFGTILIAFESENLFMVNSEKTLKVFKLPQFNQVQQSVQFLQKNPTIILVKDTKVFVAGQSTVVYFDQSNSYYKQQQYLPNIKKPPINLDFKNETLMVVFEKSIKLFRKNQMNKYELMNDFSVQDKLQFCQFLFIPQFLFENKIKAKKINIKSQQRYKSICGIYQNGGLEETELEDISLQFKAKYQFNEDNSSQVFGVTVENVISCIKISSIQL